MQVPAVAILIVEDDATTNTVLRELLSDEAVTALSATSLREARNYIRTRNVVGVVLDYTLPDGIAEELLHELALAHHPPGVVLTSAHPRARELAARYGIDCIRKPLRLDDVVAAVRGFVERQGADTPRQSVGPDTAGRYSHIYGRSANKPPRG